MKRINKLFLYIILFSVTYIILDFILHKRVDWIGLFAGLLGYLTVLGLMYYSSKSKK